MVSITSFLNEILEATQEGKITWDNWMNRLKSAHRAANLGAVETIAGPPATTSHVECTAEERAAMGIPENLVRYSVALKMRMT